MLITMAAPHRSHAEREAIMPGLDGTGPRGQGALCGGGRGFRNHYSATGLAGWQRARMDAATRTPETRTDRIAELETRLDEALARLARFEGTE
jgi:hypothetical protein